MEKITIKELASRPAVRSKQIKIDEASGIDLVKRGKKQVVNQYREVRQESLKPLFASKADASVFQVDPNLLKTEDQIAEESVPLLEKDPLKP